MTSPADPLRSQTRPPAGNVTELIDGDVHNVVPDTHALFPYLSDHWREHINNTLFKGVPETSYPRWAPTTERPGSELPDWRQAASDLSVIKRDVLDADQLSFAVLCCTYAIDSLHNPDAAIAMARAVNDWQIAEWLDKDERLRATIVVPTQLPAEASREIDRVGDHPGFVQVGMPVRSAVPYGSRLHAPLWDAISRKRLVGAIHFGGAPGTPPTPSGWPSYYLEEHVGMAQVFQTQVVSLVTEGVFDLHPDLRVVLLEAGVTWMGPFLWRFDKEWRNLRRLVPWVKRAPSAYVRDHIRLTIQPVDAPASDIQLRQAIEQIGSDEMLVYSSDYPHRHASEPSRLLSVVTESHAARIRSANARALWKLP